MRNWLIIIGLIGYCQIIFSQIVSLSLTGDADLYEKDIIKTQTGQTYILCGRSTGPLEESVVVFALNSKNEVLWKKLITSDLSILRPGFLKEMPNGNLLVIMDDFAPGANLGGSNIAMAILQPDGVMISQKRIGTVLYEELDDVIFTDSGNILFLGNMATDNGYGVFLLEVNESSIIEIVTFQIGLYDYLTKLITYNDKLYAFGTTYFFPGPAQPMLVELDLDYNVTNVWVFHCPELQGRAGSLFADENGFHIEVSYEDRAVFFRFENGVISTQPKDHGYGLVQNIHQNGGLFYYFNGVEYSLKRNQVKKYHIGTQNTGIAKMAFQGDQWYGLGSLLENNKSIIHYANDFLEPDENCGSYPFGDLPPSVDKSITVQTPANHVFTAPLVRYFTTTDQVVTDAIVEVSTLCTKVSTSEIEEEPWVIFPNPAWESIQLTYEGDFQILSVEGKLVLSGHTGGIIEVSTLSSGYYILKTRYKVSSFIKH